jgi:hypothetical protein
VVASIRDGVSTGINRFLSARRILEEIGLGSHKLTIFGLFEPCLIFGESGIITGAGTVAKLDFALSPPTFLAQSLTLLTFWAVVVACIRVSGERRWCSASVTSRSGFLNGRGWKRL